MDSEGYRNLFFPYAAQRLKNLHGNLAHYTSVDTAIKIIQNEEIWMTHPKDTNDLEEINHAQKILKQIFEGEWGTRFLNVLNAAHYGLGYELYYEKIIKYLQLDWLEINHPSTVFITCFTEHVDDEDRFGRLSMWRAYGGSENVALCFNLRPFKEEIGLEGIYSSPILYAEYPEFLYHFVKLVLRLENNLSRLKDLSREDVYAHADSIILYAIICTKHPCFREEQEWRVLNLGHNTNYIIDENSAKGPIKRLLLSSALPDKGHPIRIGKILDKVIVGPSDNKGTIIKELERTLMDCGLDKAIQVKDSEIPFRTNK